MRGIALLFIPFMFLYSNAPCPMFTMESNKDASLLKSMLKNSKDWQVINVVSCMDLSKTNIFDSNSSNEYLLQGATYKNKDYGNIYVRIRSESLQEYNSSISSQVENIVNDISKNRFIYTLKRYEKDYINGLKAIYIDLSFEDVSLQSMLDIKLSNNSIMTIVYPKIDIENINFYTVVKESKKKDSIYLPKWMMTHVVLENFKNPIKSINSAVSISEAQDEEKRIEEIIKQRTRLLNRKKSDAEVKINKLKDELSKMK